MHTQLLPDLTDKVSGGVECLSSAVASEILWSRHKSVKHTLRSESQLTSLTHSCFPCGCGGPCQIPAEQRLQTGAVTQVRCFVSINLFGNYSSDTFKHLFLNYLEMRLPASYLEWKHGMSSGHEFGTIILELQWNMFSTDVL